MQFKIQYWLKSTLVQTEVTEKVFLNVTELRDWIKPRLDNKSLDAYEWTILLDKSDVGQGHYTILHSEDNINDLLARMDLHPKYKAWVKSYATQIRTLLNL